MPSFSFDENDDGRAVAVVKGGAENGSILYLHDSDTCGRKPALLVDRKKYTTELRGLTANQKTQVFAQIDLALKRKAPASVFDGEAHIQALYEKVLRDHANTQELTLDDEGMFEILPNPSKEKREVVYICGQSGSGKSYFAKTYADYYKKLFPSRNVYLISELAEDKTLDVLKFLKRLSLESLIEDPPNLKEFHDCLVIFDDFDSLAPKANKFVLSLIDKLAIMGRHTCTSMMVLSHYTTNYAKTRLILSEATHIVVYPTTTAFAALKHLLENHAGVDVEDLKRHRDFGSRWICYFKGFPTFCIAQRDAELLNQRCK